MFFYGLFLIYKTDFQKLWYIQKVVTQKLGLVAVIPA